MGGMAIRTASTGGLVRFGLLALIWGLSFLFIKLGDEGFSPIQVTLGRLVFGTGTLLLILLVRRDRLPRGRRVWFHLAVAGLILNAIPFSLFAYAEQHTSSTLAGICNATTPLWTVVVALLALPDERPDRRRTAGLAVGFLGVLLVLGAWRGAVSGDLLGAGMAIAAAGCYGIGWVYLRRFLTGTPNSALALSAGQLLAAAVEVALVAPLLTGLPRHVAPLPLLAVATLGTFGTGIAYVLQYGLIRNGGAVLAATVTYLIPIVAAAAGIGLLHEHPSWNQPVGALVVLAGAALSQLRPRRPAGITPERTGGFRGRGRDAASRHAPSPERCTAPVRSDPARR
ncbi:transporter [Actinocatenispora sera]|uniref:Transporter n=2 Tax=Actinocatenispora sera TaxID=390989 RepID=A0A810L204_9ACTN|nr:transporter [Actinocatenispora sera]